MFALASWIQVGRYTQSILSRAHTNLLLSFESLPTPLEHFSISLFYVVVVWVFFLVLSFTFSIIRGGKRNGCANKTKTLSESLFSLIPKATARFILAKNVRICSFEKTLQREFRRAQCRGRKAFREDIIMPNATRL